MAYGDYSATITRRDGGATLTYANTSDTTKIIQSPTFEWQENYPRKVTLYLDNTTTTLANNILSDSFAGWSAGTGALALGDLLQLSYWPTADTQLRVVFDGIITDYGQAESVVLTITAKDYLEVYENTVATIPLMAGYRDKLLFASEAIATGVKLTDVTDAGIVLPLVSCEYANADILVETGDTVAGTDEQFTNTAYGIAQGFVAQYNALSEVSIGIRYEDAINTDFTVTVHMNDQNWGDRPGLAIDTKTVNKTAASSGSATITFSFVSSYVPVYLTIGQLYWIQIKASSITPDTYVQIEGCSEEPGIPTYYAYQTGADTWSAAAGCFDMDMYFLDYADIGPESYYVDETADEIYLATPYSTTTKGVKAARLSYIYSTFTHQTATQRMIQYNYHAIDSATSANQTLTLNYFSPGSNTLATALRILCNMFQTADAWNGYQTCVSHYKSGATNYIKIGQRYKVGNDPVRIFSHGNDTEIDNEHRIITAKLKRRTLSGTSMVRVIGESITGEPLILTTHNYGKSNSLGTYMRGFLKGETIRSANNSSLDVCFKTAKSVMESSSPNIIEGSIVVSGCFPDLMDITAANDTYGSGKIISLNYSPLGIVDVDFKVKGVVVSSNTTEIQLSNTDILKKNAIEDNKTYRDSTSTFYVPVGDEGTKYLHIYDAVAEDCTTAYMSLQTDAGAELTNLQRVLCTKYVDTINNLNIYHAEFIAGNGYSVSMIGQVKLYDAETSGNVEADYDLNTSSPTIYLGLYKYTGDKLIVDYTTKIS